jgi:hypothetical protein
MLPGIENQAGVIRSFYPFPDRSMGYKLQSGKSLLLFATAIHAILAEVANHSASQIQTVV